MMKFILLLLLNLFAFSAVATSSETRTFFYDGSQQDVLMSLNAEQTRTEYRYETRRTTCYRRQVYYRRICQNTPSGRRCQSIPYYRSVAYRCTQTVRVPYQVKEFDVQASIDLRIINAPKNAAETFIVTLNGDQLSLSASGSKRYIAVLKNKDISREISGSVKFLSAYYVVELVKAAPVINALNMESLSVNNSVVEINLGRISAPELIGYELQVLKAPSLGSNTVLIDREISRSEVDLIVGDRSSVAKINFNNLGLNLERGRHKVTASAFFKTQGQVLNGKDFNNLKVSKTIVFKNR